MDGKLEAAIIAELRKLIEDIEAARQPENEALYLAAIRSVRERQSELSR